MVKEQLVRQASVVVASTRQHQPSSLSLLTCKKRADTAVESELPPHLLTEIQGVIHIDIDPSEKIDTISQLQKLENGLQPEEVLNLFISYYNSIIDCPVIEEGSSDGYREKIN